MLESLLDKVAGLQVQAQVFPSEFGEIFKKTCFAQHLRTAASEILIFLVRF